jgi:hypothetical protein
LIREAAIASSVTLKEIAYLRELIDAQACGQVPE